MVIEASIGSLAVNGNGNGNGWQWCLRLLIGCAVGRIGQRILSCKRIAILHMMRLHVFTSSCMCIDGSMGRWVDFPEVSPFEFFQQVTMANLCVASLIYVYFEFEFCGPCLFARGVAF